MATDTLFTALVIFLVVSSCLYFWCWTQALINCRGKKSAMFNSGWMFKPELFSEKGNRYRKVCIGLTISGVLFAIAVVAVSL